MTTADDRVRDAREDLVSFIAVSRDCAHALDVAVERKKWTIIPDIATKLRTACDHANDKLIATIKEQQ